VTSTLLINNAGICGPTSICSPVISTAAHREMETNYFGTPVRWCGAFRAGSIAGNGGGGILNVLSVLLLGELPGPQAGTAPRSRRAWSMTNARPRPSWVDRGDRGDGAPRPG